MSDGNHNNYLSASEASNSSRFIYTSLLYNTDSVVISLNNIGTLISYKEVSSCKEIQEKLLLYGSMCDYYESFNDIPPKPKDRKLGFKIFIL